MNRRIPTDEDYTTSTNPERFDAIVEYAKELIAELESEFVVDRGEGDWSEDFPHLASFNESSAAPIRLTPSIGVPLAFGFTSAPGVALRVGQNVRLLFPDCLCDACNSQVDEMCDELRFHVEAISSGNFAEKVGRRKHQWTFEGAGRRRATDCRPPRSERKTLGKRGDYRSEPWERRAS
ncbi:MAG: DUF6226 family protein [Actinomycetota bacterium]|nr:DUF6226 family protein [Actinomycetota bacterium]